MTLGASFHNPGAEQNTPAETRARLKRDAIEGMCHELPRVLSPLHKAFERGDLLGHTRLLLNTIRRGFPELSSAILGHPLGDDWHDFALTCLRMHWGAAAGHLYVAANAMHPQLLKVGMTRLTPAARLAQMASAGVVGNFVLLGEWPVHDRHWLERQAHERMSHAPRHKEFFAIAWADAFETIEAVIKDDRALFERAGFPLVDPPTTNAERGQS